jgi:hypothetical protein
MWVESDAREEELDFCSVVVVVVVYGEGHFISLFELQ